MKKAFTIIAAVCCISTAFAQDIKIKKGEIQLDKQTVAKIEKQKEGYKISSLDGSTWFVAKAINITQTKNVATNYWLELTGSNGNIREVEYRKIPSTLSNEKWHVNAILYSDTGLLTTSGVSKEAVEQFFQTQDRSVSEKWDAIIAEWNTENAEEDALAKQDKIAFDGRIIKRSGETVGFIQKQETPQGTVPYTYSFFDSSKNIIAQTTFYREENLNRNGLFLKLANGEKVPLNLVSYNFSKINFDDLTKRAVHKLYAMGYLQQAENPDDPKYLNSRDKAWKEQQR